ncbi:cell division protein ZapA [Altererythrobacter aquiaggeris]|uniref:cell division protein ZapA n=1 Tax=Aestuarierythrobacter aquiaggeris TaxID=1898396 RepID=UPI0030193235
MSEVTLTIGGKDYVVACGDGEEAHIARLGQSIDAKLKQMGDTGGNEARRLLFASLLLADEVADLKNNSAEPPPLTAGASGAAEDAEMADLLERMADRLEGCASLLEKR